MKRDDPERLQVLAKSKLLDTESEEVYDRFTRLAATLLGVPVSLVSLVDRDRQYFKSHYGLPEPWASRQQTPLSHSFCQHVVSSQQPLIVADAREEALLKDNLAIPELGVIAYLGFPLIVHGQALGSLCAIDTSPRIWSPREIEIVQELAHFVATEIALRIEMAERQKISEQLRESEERFRALANHAPIMIWQMDAERGATFFNATWSTFTGLSEQESLGTGWIVAIHPDDREATIELWKRALRENQPFHTEFRLLRADGVVCDVISHSSVYADQSGTSGSSIGTILDVTQQKKLDFQREAFISMATHELKTPLTSVSGFIQLAQRLLNRLLRDPEELSARQQATLHQINSMHERSLTSLQGQTRLIDDLLDLSRVHAKKIELQLAPCDLVQIVQQTIQDQQASVPQRRLSFEPPEMNRYIVEVDAQRIRQVLSNYITNAFKYSPPEQPIEVGIFPQENAVYVWVRDHGIGLSPEQQAHIWDRFYQTNETPFHGGTPGLGLGLYICQMLIRSHNGEVGVESTKGRGSTFWFSLPLIPQDVEQAYER